MNSEEDAKSIFLENILMPKIPNIMDYNHIKVYVEKVNKVIPLFWTEDDRSFSIIYRTSSSASADTNIKFLSGYGKNLLKNFEGKNLLKKGVRLEEGGKFLEIIPFSKFAVNMVLFFYDFNKSQSKPEGYYKLFKRRQDPNFSLSEALEGDLDEIDIYEFLKRDKRKKKQLYYSRKKLFDLIEKKYDLKEYDLKEYRDSSHHSPVSLRSFLDFGGELSGLNTVFKNNENLIKNVAIKLGRLDYQQLNKPIGIINIKLSPNRLNSALHLFSKDNYYDVKRANRNLNKKAKEIQYSIAEKNNLNVSVLRFKSNIHDSTQIIHDNISEIVKALKKNNIYKSVESKLKGIQDEATKISEKVNELHLGQQEYKKHG